MLTPEMVTRRLPMVLWDVTCWFVATIVMVGARYDFGLSQVQWSAVLLYPLAAAVVQVVGGYLLKIYLGRNRIGSFEDALSLGTLAIVIALCVGVGSLLFVHQFPRGVALMVPPLALLLMAFGRWVYRAIFAVGLPVPDLDAEPTLIYGAGDFGRQVAHLLRTTPGAPWRVEGFLDDDPAKRFFRAEGSKVLGTIAHLETVVSKSGARVLILAQANPRARVVQELTKQTQELGMKLLVLPPIREMIGGQVSLNQLHEVKVEDLLGRRVVKTDLGEISSYVTDRVVLVTGAGGSIGAELARQIHGFGPRKLVLLDRDESALHGVQLDLYGIGLLDSDDMVLCDIRDAGALEQVFEHHRPEVVFHAAALKHLPMLEQYPDEGWKTNVMGSANVLKFAHRYGVEVYVNISTDKAADPTSVLGRTKRRAEQLTAWYAAENGCTYLSVRFGNVLGSRGSMLHTFRSQINRGGPVTITDPQVTRYFMTIPEACELVMQAGAIGRPGDVMVLDMGTPVRIRDVAERLIHMSGKKIDIVYTGLRSGEKLHEVLLSGVETADASPHPLITRVKVPALSPEDLSLAGVGEDTQSILHRVRQAL